MKSSGEEKMKSFLVTKWTYWPVFRSLFSIFSIPGRKVSRKNKKNLTVMQRFHFRFWENIPSCWSSIITHVSFAWCQRGLLRLKASLQIDQASLNEPDCKTKIVISCLARMAKESNRFDVFQHLRQIAPAGATGESVIHPNYILGLADEKRLYHERASIICQRSPS